MKELGYYNGRIGELAEMTVPMSDRACWFVRQALKADWHDLRAWRHAAGMLSDRNRGAGE